MIMSACTFFGHRDCGGLDREKLWMALEQLVTQGVDLFYVGNQGGFDRSVYGQLKRLRDKYPTVRIAVVLAYLPTEKRGEEWEADALYPEGLEHCPVRFAVDRRNRWMIDSADYCICYVNHTWGGAYRTLSYAKKRKKNILNLSGAQI